jgi:hypothetical protein
VPNDQGDDGCKDHRNYDVDPYELVVKDGHADVVAKRGIGRNKDNARVGGHFVEEYSAQ